MTYTEWIVSNVPEHKDAYGKCASVVKAMAEAFPELRVVKGHVFTTWGKRAHWWLTTPNGTIVDPTVRQFEAVGEYEPWVPGDEVRVGKCMNCGDEIWKVLETLDKDPGNPGICSSEWREYLDGKHPAPWASV